MGRSMKANRRMKEKKREEDEERRRSGERRMKDGVEGGREKVGKNRGGKKGLMQ